MTKVAYKGLDQLCTRMERYETTHRCDGQLATHLKAVRYDVQELRDQFRKTYHISTSRRILIALGLAFLSTCTIRYWLDKYERYSAVSAPCVIPIEQAPTRDIESILRRVDGNR